MNLYDPVIDQLTGRRHVGGEQTLEWVLVRRRRRVLKRACRHGRERPLWPVARMGRLYQTIDDVLIANVCLALDCRNDGMLS